MSLKTLQTVLKTASVGSVKLTTPADRVGFGVLTDSDIDYPAAILSPGHFPLPRPSEPEPVARSRQEVPDVMSMPPSAIAAHGPTEGISGKPSRHTGFDRLARLGAAATARPLTAPAAAPEFASAASSGTAGGEGRASLPGFCLRQRRIGRDCQSPDRQDAKRQNPNARASNRPWQRTTWSVAAGRK